jgi:GTP-binding protein EngB required for normal cell division
MRSALPRRLDALAKAVEVSDGKLPAEVADRAQFVLQHAGERRRLSTDHTVVALAGATGSGKSSLFNAVAGMRIAPVGVRRPTTSEPMACVWGTIGVAPLLRWLGVPRRHQIARESVLDSGEQDRLEGLVLLDLPDHDSTETNHRAVVDRLITQVDLFVWVLDPQKYADAVLHERYLKPLAAHSSVTVVALNQIDRLAPADVERCVADLRRLLVDDGLGDVPIMPVSAVTGEGLDEFADLLRAAVARRRAVDQRLEADVVTVAEEVAAAAGDGEPRGVDDADRARLVEALCDAAGVDVVAVAAGRSYLARARASTGWPLTRWVGRLRADPIRRLGLGRSTVSELARTSMPEPTPVERARADTAVRRLADAAIGTVTGAWRDSLRATATQAAGRLPDALDQAVVSADLQIGRRPVWWRLVGFFQWLALALAAAGALWLLALAAASFLQFDLTAPEVGALPIPTIMLVGGVLIGVVLAGVSLAAARTGAARRTATVRKQLREVVAGVAKDVVIEPLERELGAYRTFGKAVRKARS